MNTSVLHYSTDRVASYRRLEYWNDLICSTFTALQSQPLDKRRFSGSLSKIRLHDLGLAEAFSLPARVQHRREMIARETEAVFLVHLQLRGQSINRQDGREALLKAGDYALCDSTRPYELSFSSPNNMLVLRVPEQKLKQWLNAPEDLTCVAMSGTQGISALFSSLLRGVWGNYLGVAGELDGDSVQAIQPALVSVQGQLEDYLEEHKKLSDNLLSLLATSYLNQQQQRCTQSSVQHARRIRIKGFIEQHLREPELSPQLIAQAFRISPRYLHLLFQAEQESIAQYILRRRLEEVRRRLEDPLYGGKTVSEIAFAWGFNNATHFGRVFKQQFGVTPADFQKPNRRGG